MEPYAVYISRAEGAYQWDVDGNRYIDYIGGNGALLFGSNHPDVCAAILAQLRHGTHFAASHPLEIEWAKTIRSLMPYAERVRFTGSGSESSLLAFRLARAFTGRSKIIRFYGHFHGWQDHATSGLVNHFDASPTPGVLREILDNIVLLPANDIDAGRVVLERQDVAATILEPTGGSFGKLPIVPSFVNALRELTQKHGTLLIFDEVVTGFRVAPGGAQELWAVTPDIGLLGKILAGGLPGSALIGRADILSLLDWGHATKTNVEKIPHQGTFNANPLSAAAGTATLDLVSRTDACNNSRLD
jgi:glutamate-1-semialdehyde 2,1-aminomutase